MSYSVTTYSLSLDKLQAVCGSGDTSLLQEIITNESERLLGVDSMGEYFEDFEEEIEKEYEAYRQGNFSYQHEIWEPIEEDDDEEEIISEEDRDKLLEALKSGDNATAASLVEQALGDDFFGDDDDEPYDEEDYQPQRELTAGGALADLLLARPTDPSFGYKYGYALEALCAHLGKTHHPAAWSAINFRAIDAIKQVVPPMPSGENIEGILHRGSPVSMPQSDDFPAMGYLKLAEIETLRPLVQQAIVACDGNKEKEWEQEALAELQSWLDQATDAGDDLVFFYY